MEKQTRRRILSSSTAAVLGIPGCLGTVSNLGSACSDPDREERKESLPTGLLSGEDYPSNRRQDPFEDIAVGDDSDDFDTVTKIYEIWNDASDTRDIEITITSDAPSRKPVFRDGFSFAPDAFLRIRDHIADFEAIREYGQFFGFCVDGEKLDDELWLPVLDPGGVVRIAIREDGTAESTEIAAG